MKVIITGGYGLVGYGLQNTLYNNCNYNTIFMTRKMCDLTNEHDTLNFFMKEQADYVIHLAAMVGGLFKNMNYKVDMLEKNISINTNVLKACYLSGVKKVISCLSTCIFPNTITYPINETMLHNGPPHHSNDSYAYAKRLLEIHSRAYQEQYDKDFICIIPTNIYGPNDNYSLTDGHVIPALIHRCYLAKMNNEDFVVKGSGTPLRQFIYSLDLSKLILWTLEEYKERDTIILSVGEDQEVSIKDIAIIIADCYDYSDRIVFDTDYSDGQYKKTADNSKLKHLCSNLDFMNITEGIKRSVDWFIENYDTCRK